MFEVYNIILENALKEINRSCREFGFTTWMQQKLVN
jgi:hypothetical protein